MILNVAFLYMFLNAELNLLFLKAKQTLKFEILYQCFSGI